MAASPWLLGNAAQATALGAAGATSQDGQGTTVPPMGTQGQDGSFNPDDPVINAALRAHIDQQDPRGIIKALAHDNPVKALAKAAQAKPPNPKMDAASTGSGSAPGASSPPVNPMSVIGIGVPPGISNPGPTIGQPAPLQPGSGGGAAGGPYGPNLPAWGTGQPDKYDIAVMSGQMTPEEAFTAHYQDDPQGAVARVQASHDRLQAMPQGQPSPDGSQGPFINGRASLAGYNKNAPDNVGPFIGGPNSLDIENTKDRIMDQYLGAMPDGKHAGTPAENPDGPPAPDPHIGEYLNAAQVLRQKAADFAPPKFPGMTPAQALVGIVGAAATINNPHAEFVRNYMPALAQQIQNQYGSSMQGWEAAKAGMLDVANSLQARAMGIQNYQAEIYKAQMGYLGQRGRGAEAATTSAGARVDVANIAANAKPAHDDALFIQSQAKLLNDSQRAMMTQAVNAITNGGENEKAAGYAMLQKAVPGLLPWSSDRIAAAAQELTPKQDLQEGEGQNQVATAGLRTAQQKTEDAERQGAVNLIGAKYGLTLDQQKYELAKTAKIPPELAVESIHAKAYATYASAMASEARTKSAAAGKDLDQKTAAQLQQDLRAADTDVTKRITALDEFRRSIVANRTAYIQAPGGSGKIDQGVLDGFDAQDRAAVDTINDLSTRERNLQMQMHALPTVPAAPPSGVAPASAISVGPVSANVKSATAVTPPAPTGASKAVGQAQAGKMPSFSATGNIAKDLPAYTKFLQGLPPDIQKRVLPSYNAFRTAIAGVKTAAGQQVIWDMYAEKHGLNN